MAAQESESGGAIESVREWGFCYVYGWICMWMVSAGWIEGRGVARSRGRRVGGLRWDLDARQKRHRQRWL